MAAPCRRCGQEHASGQACPVDDSLLTGESRLGQVFGGRYHLVRLLGDGGMGSVYKAADRVLRRFVALKVLHREVVDRPRAVERFVREARAAAAIGHPNIIDVLDFGEHDGLPFLVMEYLRGRPLSDVIAAEAPLPVERAARIATHTLAGLAAAHQEGILHRDLKPANLMLVLHLGDPDFVKVCDFGFAALMAPLEHIDESGRILTPARTLVGTPSYAAPERLRGEAERDPRSDVWSVGVVLYEMLTGRRPFRAPSFAKLVKLIRKAEVPPPTRYRRDLSPKLEAVLMRALAKDPAERWPSAEAFAEALVPFGGHRVAVDRVEHTERFSMDLIQLRARETARHRALSRKEAGRVLDSDRTEVEDRERLAGPAERSPSVGTPPADGAVVSGALVQPLLRRVRRFYGRRALGRVLKELPPTDRAALLASPKKGDWVSFETLLAFTQAVDRVLGQDDLSLVVECGKAAAEGLFDAIVAQHPSSPPLELLVAEMPDILARYVSAVRWRLHHTGRGYARVEVREQGEPELASCVVQIGLFERCLDRFGGKEVEVNLASCRALGDERCVLDATWL